MTLCSSYDASAIKQGRYGIISSMTKFPTREDILYGHILEDIASRLESHVHPSLPGAWMKYVLAEMSDESARYILRSITEAGWHCHLSHPSAPVITLTIASSMELLFMADKV